MGKETIFVNGIQCDSVFKMDVLDDFLRIQPIEYTNQHGERKEINLEETIKMANPDYKKTNGLNFQTKNGNCTIEIVSHENAEQLAKVDISTQIACSEKATQLVSGDDPNQFIDGRYGKQIAIGRNVSQIANGSYVQQISVGENSKQLSISANAKQCSYGKSSTQFSIGQTSEQFSFGNNSIQLSVGDHTSHESIGNNNIILATGLGSIAKGSVGTWITLVERDYLEKDFPIVHVATAQIGNADYLDCDEHILSSDNFYSLVNKQFVPIVMYQGATYKKCDKLWINDTYEIYRLKEIYSKTEEIFFLYETPTLLAGVKKRILVKRTIDDLLIEIKKLENESLRFERQMQEEIPICYEHLSLEQIEQVKRTVRSILEDTHDGVITEELVNYYSETSTLLINKEGYIYPNF